MKEKNNFLLTGDNLVSDIHFRLPRFTYSVCGPFTKRRQKEKIQRFKETGDSRYFYWEKLDKAFFQHDTDILHI